MLQSIGFGWFILAAFLFSNLVWFWDTAITPPPRTMRKKRAPRSAKLMIKKVTRRPLLPMAQLHQLSARKPVAQPIP